MKDVHARHPLGTRTNRQATGSWPMRMVLRLVHRSGPPPQVPSAPASLLTAGDHDLLILDELTYIVTYGWLPISEVVAGSRDRAPRTNVVLTGRDAPGT